MAQFVKFCGIIIPSQDQGVTIFYIVSEVSHSDVMYLLISILFMHSYSL